MRIIKILITFLLLPSLLFGKVAFFQGSLNDAQRTAAMEGRPYFIDFYANYCLPCKLMDQTTFMDEDLATYIANNYVALKLNVDAFDAYEVRNSHEIKALPTIMIFSSSGRLLESYEGSMTATTLSKLLDKHNLPENRGKATPPPVEYTYADEVETSVPVKTPSVPSKSVMKPVATVVEKPTVAPQKVQATVTKPVASSSKPVATVVEKPTVAPQKVQATVTKPIATPSKPVATVVEKPTVVAPQKVQPAVTKPVATAAKPTTTNTETIVLAIPKQQSTFKPNIPAKTAAAITSTVPNKSISNTEPTTTATTPDKTQQQPEPKQKMTGLFEFTSSRHPFRGYAIQIGLFAEYSNVLTEVEKIQKLFPDRKILIHIDELNGTTVYRVAVGTFTSYVAAKNYMPIITGQGFEGFVKNLTTLE